VIAVWFVSGASQLPESRPASLSAREARDDVGPPGTIQHREHLTPRPEQPTAASEKPFDVGRPVGDDLLMFRYAFLLAASAVADAPKAAVPIIVAAVDGARS
jgi:hypothetical protein